MQAVYALWWRDGSNSGEALVLQVREEGISVYREREWVLVVRTWLKRSDMKVSVGLSIGGLGVTASWWEAAYTYRWLDFNRDESYMSFHLWRLGGVISYHA